jgi:hypothetical protein
MIFSAANAGEPIVAPIGEKGPVIRYYPNPISSILTLEVQQAYINEFKSVEVKIVNLLGQEMIPVVTRDMNTLQTEIKIDLSDIPSGVYFMEVYSTVNGNTVKQTRKITKS